MLKLMMFLSCLISFSIAQDYHATQHMLDLESEVIEQMQLGYDLQAVSQKVFDKSIDQILKMAQAVDPSIKIQTADIYLSNKKMRMDMSIEGKKTTVIFRLDKSKLYTIYNTKKEYLEMDLKKIRQLKNDVQSMAQNAMSQMGDALKNLTPEQKAQMEGLFGGKKKKPAIKVFATGKTKTINGFSSSEYRVESTKKMEQYWIAKSYPQMRELYKQIAEAFPEDQEEDEQLWNKINKGWPVSQTSITTAIMGSGLSLDVNEITSIQKTHLSAKMFEPPAGYKKTTMENMFKKGMRSKGVK